VRSHHAGAPIHPKAIITILDPADIDTWLRRSYDDIVRLHKPYDPAKMTVREPVFAPRSKER
jgi:putative SOS response-associated peptidase YedK